MKKAADYVDILKGHQLRPLVVRNIGEDKVLLFCGIKKKRSLDAVVLLQAGEIKYVWPDPPQNFEMPFSCHLLGGRKLAVAKKGLIELFDIFDQTSENLKLPERLARSYIAGIDVDPSGRYLIIVSQFDGAFNFLYVYDFQEKLMVLIQDTELFEVYIQELRWLHAPSTAIFKNSRDEKSLLNLDLQNKKVTIDAAVHVLPDSLFECVAVGDLGRLKQLLSSGEDVDGLPLERYSEITPLGAAIVNDNKEIAEMLLEHGADPNLNYYLGGVRYPYPLCVRSLDMLNLLIRYNVSLNVTDSNKNTLLHKFARGRIDKPEEAIQLVLAKKACRLNAKNKDGEIPMDLAVTDSIKSALQSGT